MVSDIKLHVGHAGGHRFLGAYVSHAGLVPPSDNYILNDSPIFQRNLDSTAKHARELKYAMGSPLQVPSQVYSLDCDSHKDGTAVF